MFLGIFENRGAHYIIMKIPQKDKFLDKANIVFARKDMNISKCSVLADTTQKKSIKVSAFPYLVLFFEINKEREKSTINQLCGGQEPSYLSATSRKP